MKIYLWLDVHICGLIYNSDDCWGISWIIFIYIHVDAVLNQMLVCVGYREEERRAKERNAGHTAEVFCQGAGQQTEGCACRGSSSEKER